MGDNQQLDCSCPCSDSGGIHGRGPGSRCDADVQACRLSIVFCFKELSNLALPPPASSALVMSILALQVGTMRQDVVDGILYWITISDLSTQKQPKTSE